MDKAITSMTSYLCGVRDGPTLRPARGKRMNVANEEVLPITKTNSQCAGSRGNGPVLELEMATLELATLPHRQHSKAVAGTATTGEWV